MENERDPGFEFDHDQKVAFALAGTVALPSPFPASGRVSIGIFQQIKGQEKRVKEPTYYLKSVQLITETLIVTRIFSLSDLRAARTYTDTASTDGSAEWTLSTVEEAWGEISNTIKLIKGENLEVIWKRAAILYVLESTPVLTRVEKGLTAAESCVFLDRIATAVLTSVEKGVATAEMSLNEHRIIRCPQCGVNPFCH